MFSTVVTLWFLLASVISANGDVSFTYNGFRSADLTVDGIAGFTPNGLLRLTNDTKQEVGHAFYPNPVTFKNSSSLNDSVFSFSTTFVFAIRSVPTLSTHGIALVIAPTRGLPGALPSQFLGLFNESNNGDANNHVVAVEFDTIYSKEFNDINDNHVGIDINGLISVKWAAAGYYADNNGEFKNLTLASGQPMQVWVEYDGQKKQMDVSLAPMDVGKPLTPLLSLTRDLSPIVNSIMYVGFSSSTGSVVTSHYILGWSFKMNGQARKLVLSQLPELPPLGGSSMVLKVGLPLIISASIIAIAITGLVYLIRKKKFAELVEEWEVDCGPQRYKYKDLYIATKGFRDEQLLGTGGFGSVYRGILPMSNIAIAVKRVSRESEQGMREFVAEIISMRQLRHRNLVSLLGYCRRKRKLLLVYAYMPNGSLDKYLYNQPKTTLNWNQRFGVIKGVASALFYLHEGWEQVVIHRDVKASNVMLDNEFNGRLGDFGLARLYDHGTDPQTTHVVGTIGYLAPEHLRTGKATTNSDVFAFGAFLLEVACGRRPIETRRQKDEIVLVDKVLSCWNRGNILEAMDPNLGTDFIVEEVELVMKLGLMCSHSESDARPSMRQIVEYLERNIDLQNLELLSLSSSNLTFARPEGLDDVAATSYPSSLMSCSSVCSIEESLLSGGR